MKSHDLLYYFLCNFYAEPLEVSTIPSVAQKSSGTTLFSHRTLGTCRLCCELSFGFCPLAIPPFSENQRGALVHLLRTCQDATIYGFAHSRQRGGAPDSRLVARTKTKIQFPQIAWSHKARRLCFDALSAPLRTPCEHYHQTTEISEKTSEFF